MNVLMRFVLGAHSPTRPRVHHQESKVSPAVRCATCVCLIWYPSFDLIPKSALHLNPPLLERELRVPKVEQEDDAILCALVPHLMLKRVVEYETLALVPLSRLVATFDPTTLRHDDPQMAREPQVGWTTVRSQLCPPSNHREDGLTASRYRERRCRLDALEGTRGRRASRAVGLVLPPVPEEWELAPFARGDECTVVVRTAAHGREGAVGMRRGHTQLEHFLTDRLKVALERCDPWEGIRWVPGGGGGKVVVVGGSRGGGSVGG